MSIHHRKYPSNFWIGLAQVKAQELQLLGAENAYVNVICIAESKSNFRQKIRDALKEMNLQLKELEDAEPLANRVEQFKVDKDILILAETLFTNKDDVKFSIFHTYS